MPTLKFVRSVWQSFRATSGLEPRLLDRLFRSSSNTYSSFDPNASVKLRVTSAAPGRVHFELDIEKEHTNRLGILHGAAIASMVDLGGSFAVASRGLYSTGVSTDLNGLTVIVTYLSSGGKIGDRIRAEATCDKFGKTLAYTYINFKNNKDEVFARGSHTKYIAVAWKDPKNIVEELTSNTDEKNKSP